MYNPASPNTLTGFQYDYMIKDHLGNVRMVLTEEQKTDMYPAATMETAQAATEELYYQNLPQTRYQTSSTYPGGVQMVAKLQAAPGIKMVGPAITLRVIAGDKFHLSVNSYWKSTEMPRSL